MAASPGRGCWSTTSLGGGRGDRLATLAHLGVPIDAVVVQIGTDPGELGTVQVVAADVARANGLAHDPERLGNVLKEL